MKDRGITQFLMEHAGRSPVSFHMPGHKGSGIYRELGYGDFLGNMVDCDITEIPGADNLFQAESIIKETAEKYRELYDVKKSWPLINGTSGGLIAAILSSVSPGGKLIMARNCHKSVFNALTLGGLAPVYAYPSVLPSYGISGPLEPAEVERCLQAAPDAAAVILPSPNYYGICSDIEAIAKVVHAHGKVLIVDQAHGAHLKFMERQPAAAEDCGADIVVNSTHKTLASLTQSAVLNLNSDRVDRYVLEDKLQAIQSTSPSYLLMASLDINADILSTHGRSLFDRWQDNLDWFYREAAKVPGLKLMKQDGTGEELQTGNAAESGIAVRTDAVEDEGCAARRHSSFPMMDATKINLDMSSLGLDGNALEKLLMERDVFIELVTGNILMCMTGIGNTRRDFEKLLDALREIAQSAGCGNASGRAESVKKDSSVAVFSSSVWTKRRALHDLPPDKTLVHLEDSADKICASSIIPYPPGIPLICPGEEISREDIEYIKQLRGNGEKVIGVGEHNEITVGV